MEGKRRSGKRGADWGFGIGGALVVGNRAVHMPIAMQSSSRLGEFEGRPDPEPGPENRPREEWKVCSVQCSM